MMESIILRQGNTKRNPEIMGIERVFNVPSFLIGQQVGPQVGSLVSQPQFVPDILPMGLHCFGR
jgi:hypothetical protein